MGIMDAIRRVASKKSEKSEKFKQMQEDDRLQNILEERKKSANRRELEKYYEKEEEKQIKIALDKIHKKENKEMWSRNDYIGKKATILQDNKKLLGSENSILSQKNIFKSNKTKGSCQFFK